MITDGRDEEHISRGIYAAYTEGYLRYSQVPDQLAGKYWSQERQSSHIIDYGATE